MSPAVFPTVPSAISETTGRFTLTVGVVTVQVMGTTALLLALVASVLAMPVLKPQLPVGVNVTVTLGRLVERVAGDHRSGHDQVRLDAGQRAVAGRADGAGGIAPGGGDQRLAAAIHDVEADADAAHAGLIDTAAGGDFRAVDRGGLDQRTADSRWRWPWSGPWRPGCPRPRPAAPSKVPRARTTGWRARN